MPRRSFIIVLAAFIAVLLHTSLCEWRTSTMAHPMGWIFVWTQVGEQIRLVRKDGRRGRWTGEGPPQMVTRKFRTERYTGLFVQGDSESRSMAIVFGVALPIALLGLSACLATDARRARRLHVNQCTSCGYPRHGLPADSVCPECGLPGSSPTNLVAGR